MVAVVQVQRDYTPVFVLIIVVVFILVFLGIFLIYSRDVTPPPPTESTLFPIRRPLFDVQKGNRNLTFGGANSGGTDFQTPITNWTASPSPFFNNTTFNPTTGVFTVPRNGVYLLEFSLFYGTVTAGAVPSNVTSRQIGVNILNTSRGTTATLAESDVLLSSALTTVSLTGGIIKYQNFYNLVEGDQLAINFYQKFNVAPTTPVTATLTFPATPTASSFSSDLLDL